MIKGVQAPSKAAILRYMEQKKKEEEAAKEKRFQEMLNPYKKFNKKSGEPDEEFLKSQKKRERLLKKKEDAQRKVQEQADRLRLQKQNEELSRLKKQQDELRAIEEKKREEKIRKQAIFGKPVDKKMKEYLEKIKAQRESGNVQKTAAEVKREERRRLEESIYGKTTRKPRSTVESEKEREKRILENMRKVSNQSIKPNGSQNGQIPSKSTVKSKPIPPTPSVTSTTLSSSVTSTRIPKTKPRASEYSPTRPSIITKSQNGNRGPSKPDEYKVGNAKDSKGKVLKSKSSAESYKPTPQYIPSPKKPSKDSNGLFDNGHKVKPRSETMAGNQISRSASSSSNLPPAKRPKPTPKESIKNGMDALRERERLLKEKELQAAHELEKQKARNKELEQQLAKEREKSRLRLERDRDREQALAKVREMKARRPVASNKILPPIGFNYRRNMNYRPVSYDDDEEEDDDMSDFIDDGDDAQDAVDIGGYIRDIFGYDKRKYALVDEDDIEEASFAQQMKEEIESAKAGLREDLEDMRKEEEEKRRKKLKKRRRQIDDSDED